MVTLVVGILIGACAGALVGGALAAASRSMRLGLVGAPFIGASLGGASYLLLQAIGGGVLRFVPETGMVDWPPVVATLVAGGGCAGVASICIALMRLGSRAHRIGRNRRRAPTRRYARRSSVRRGGESAHFRATPAGRAAPRALQPGAIE